jgi:hypothetical protein
VQRHRREAVRKKAEQNRRLMDKNRIMRPTRSHDEHMMAKSVAIKGRGGKSGRCSCVRARIRSSQKRDSSVIISSVIPSAGGCPNSQALSRKTCESTQ